jgi:RNA polymerase sigma-70 factor (ECF subfamily)
MNRSEQTRPPGRSSEGAHERDLLPTRSSLLERLKNWDDSQSWQEFFELYWRLIYSHARKAELSDAEAQEVVQDTVIAVSRRMRDFKYEPAQCSFKTWLFQIVNCRIADQFRKRKRHQVGREPLPHDEAGLPLEAIAAPRWLEPDAAWDQEWDQNLIDAALALARQRVDPRTYQIFHYRVILNHSAAETAHQLQTSRSRVHGATYRVKQLWKEELRRLQARFS